MSLSPVQALFHLHQGVTVPPQMVRGRLLNIRLRFDEWYAEDPETWIAGVPDEFGLALEDAGFTDEELIRSIYSAAEVALEKERFHHNAMRALGETVPERYLFAWELKAELKPLYQVLIEYRRSELTLVSILEVSQNPNPDWLKRGQERRR